MVESQSDCTNWVSWNTDKKETKASEPSEYDYEKIDECFRKIMDEDAGVEKDELPTRYRTILQRVIDTGKEDESVE